jgi:hypothetical protein
VIYRILARKKDMNLANVYQPFRKKVQQIFGLVPVLLSLAGYAQDLHSVSGKVLSRDGEVLMGNVVALSVTDSSFLKGNSFLDGDFELAGLDRREVLLKLTSLQFKDTVFRVVFNEKQSVQLGVIVVNDGMRVLDAVEIVGEVPLFSARPDGVLQVNVANTVLATSNSVNEILTRTPQVTIDDDGISVFGKGQAIIYLNGKRITNERLAAISASQVKSIEVISNPSAIYDAEGKAVINIITKDNLQDGYRISAQQQVTWSDMAGIASSSILNFNYKRRKVDVSGNYDLRLGNDAELLYTSRVRPAQEDYLHSDLIWDFQRDFRNVSKYSLGASYDLNGKGYASVEYNGSYERTDDLTRNRNHIVTLDEDGLYTSRVSRDGLIRNNSVTVNLFTIMDSLGSSFFIGGQLSKYTATLLDNMDEDNVVNNEEVSRLLKSNQNSDITIINPQTDFVKVYTGGNRLSIGAKLSYAKIESHLRFYRANNENEYEFDPVRSNDFEYEETVPAAYVQYDGLLGKTISYGLGLRSEWTRYTLNTTVQDNGMFRSSYINVFPNAQMSIALDKVKLRAAYTSRITRPSYQSLSPSLIYQDAFTSIEGNPELRPEKTHAFEMGAALHAFDFKVGYNYTIDPMSGAALRGDNDKSYVLKNLNFRSGHLYFATLLASFSTSWLTSTNTVSVSYNKLTDDQYGYKQVGVRPQIYIYSSNKINVGNIVTVNLIGWYLGEKYYSLRYNKSRSIVAVGVEREFLHKAIKCTLTANDIFHTNHAAGTYDVGETFVTYDRLYNLNYYRFTLTYTFGQLKKIQYKSKSTGEAENSRVR